MADTGFVLAGTGANDNSYGSAAWSNPGRVTADDASNATVNVISSSSNYLKGTNYGHSIPAGATIDGIEVQFQVSESGGSNVSDDRVRLVDETGTIGSTDRAEGTEFTTTPTNYQYGSSADLWGDTWGETDVEDARFGFVLAVVGVGFSACNADAMWTKIYYTEAGGGLSIPVAMNSYRQRHQSVV